jgi:hypothetical protein
LLYCSREVIRLRSLWNKENSLGRPREGERFEEEASPTDVNTGAAAGGGRVSEGLTMREKIISRAKGLFATNCSKTA